MILSAICGNNRTLISTVDIIKNDKFVGSYNVVTYVIEETLISLEKELN